MCRILWGIFLFWLGLPGFVAAELRSYDVVILGATPAGIMAARTVAELGLRAGIVEARDHIGGIMTSGLSASDVCHPQIVGGRARQFFVDIGKEYGKDLSWRFEPHIAARVFARLVEHKNIAVFKSRRIVKTKRSGTNLLEIITDDGSRFAGRVFIDASYEGDLLAAAGASYHVGREGRDQYREQFAGFNLKLGTERHNWSLLLSAQSRSVIEQMPNIMRTPFPRVGTGDKRVQAYNYRVCITGDPSNQVPFPLPSRYEPSEYLALAEYLAGSPNKRLAELFTILDIPGNKFDLNNGGPFSTDYIGANWDYPEASFKRRAEIEAAHKEYMLGLFHFYRTDPRVPAQLVQDFKGWGLCKDEFPSTNNWPPLLYVREGRRLVGEYVLTERDLVRTRRKLTSVGMASCPIESHAIQRVILDEGPHGTLRNEGIKSLRIHPYQIPYESLLPKATEVTNLLVPVALSASQIAYSSLRMEPVFMVLGESAGVAVAQALRHKQSLHTLDREQLRLSLKEHGQVLGALPKKYRNAERE